MEDADRARLAEAGVTVDERSVAELASETGQLTAVVFADGTRLPRTGILVATTLHQRSTLAEQLGADPGEPTPVAENPIAVDGFYRTTASGVFAAGDLCARMPQVAAAIASGSHAAAAVVQSLMADEYGLAVPEGRQRVNA
jgi:thioredoxin reductase